MNHQLTAIQAKQVTRRGSVSLICMLCVVGLALLIGYVTNMGSEILEKQRLQNAADATSYSSAVCMARGMNAVSAYNHMMGELTAIVVIIEALGGPQAEARGKYTTDEDKSLNRQIWALCGGPQEEYIPACFEGFTGGTADVTIIKNIKKLVDHKNEKADEHQCAAAIYDAQLQLKELMCPLLIAKITGSALQACKAVPFVGPGLWAAGTAIHIVAAVVLAKIYIEMKIIEFLDAGIKKAAKVKEPIRTILPYLSLVPEVIAGLGEGPGAIGSVSHTIDQTKGLMKEYYNLDRCVIYPTHLPLVREPAPKKQQGKKSEPAKDEKIKEVSEAENKANDARNQANDTVNKAREKWDKLQEEKRFYDDELELAQKEERKTRGYEKYDPEYQDLVKRIKIAEVEYDFAVKNRSTMNNTITESENVGAFIDSGLPSGSDLFGKATGMLSGSASNYSHNPSLDTLEEFDTEAEKRSQWTRATYPYVDATRAQLNTWFDNVVLGLPLSGMSKHFTRWCNRYVVNESYLLRSGSPRKTDKDNKDNNSSNSDKNRLAFMMILKQKPDDTKGDESAKDNKGNEPWCNNADFADAMFSVNTMVVAQKRVSLFGPTIFIRGRDKADITVSQAMMYNANGRNVPKQSNQTPKTQPNTGWDTLQWEPQGAGNQKAIKAPEFGEVSKGDSLEIWKLFSGRELPSDSPARVKLNWQAKLRPVTLYSLLNDKYSFFPMEIIQETDAIKKNLDQLTH